MNTTAMMMFLLPVALAAGLWWLDRAGDKRDAERAATVRRTYTNDAARSPWIRREPGGPSGTGDDEAAAAILELSSSGVFRVQNNRDGSKWMPR